MRRLKIFALFCFLFPIPCFAQQSLGFDYQALIYESGAPLKDRSVNIKLTLQDKLGQVYYEEEHKGVKTESTGLLRVFVGSGSSLKGSFLDSPWGNGLYVGASLDLGTGYKLLGPAVRLLSVPYVLKARSSGEIRGTESHRAQDRPLFEVVNSSGRSVFTVYEEGVRLQVSENASTGVKGFAVMTRKADGSDETERLRLDEGFFAQVDDELDRGVRGGFAVSTYSDELRSGKSSEVSRLSLKGPSVEFMLDDSGSRGVRGGFAVSRRTSEGIRDAFILQGGESSMIVEPRMRGVRGGFAVFLRGSDFRNGKANLGDGEVLMSLDSENAFITMNTKKGEEGAFSIRSREVLNDGQVLLKPLVGVTPDGKIVASSSNPNEVFKTLSQLDTTFSYSWLSAGGKNDEKVILSNSVRVAHPIKGSIKINGEYKKVELGVSLQQKGKLFEGLEIREILPGYSPQLPESHPVLGIALRPGYVIKEKRVIPADSIREAVSVYLLDNPSVRKPQFYEIVLYPDYFESIELVETEFVVSGADAEGDLFLRAMGTNLLPLTEAMNLERNTEIRLQNADTRVDLSGKFSLSKANKIRIKDAKAFFEEGGQKEQSPNGRTIWRKKLRIRVESEGLLGGFKEVDWNLWAVFDE